MCIALLATILLGAAPAATPPPATAAEMAAGKALLEKAIAAAGGKKELAQIQDVTYSGTLTASLGGDDAGGAVTLIELRDGTARNEMTLGGFQILSVIGPKGGYTSQAGLARTLAGNELVQAQAQSRVSALGVLLHGFEPGVVLRGLPQEDGSDVLEVRPSGGADPLTFLFDPVTHLLTAIRAVNPADGSTLVSRYSLYKPVAGVQMAHHVALSHSGLQMTFAFTKIDVNTGATIDGTRPASAIAAAPVETPPIAITTPAPYVPAATAMTVYVVNRTKKILGEVHLSPAGKKDWGANLLPMDRFHDGDTVRLPFVRGSECTFDVMVADADGQYSVVTGADLCKHDRLTLRPGKKSGLVLHQGDASP